MIPSRGEPGAEVRDGLVVEFAVRFSDGPLVVLCPRVNQ